SGGVALPGRRAPANRRGGLHRQHGVRHVAVPGPDCVVDRGRGAPAAAGRGRNQTADRGTVASCDRREARPAAGRGGPRGGPSGAPARVRGIMPPMSFPVIVTGAAGFIGMHLCRRLLAEGRAVVGIDNLNDYYDPRLKRARLATLEAFEGFTFHQADVSDRVAMAALFDRHAPRQVVHLAAQAGVRYALTNPMAYS